jgi:hypothetical protein
MVRRFFSKSSKYPSKSLNFTKQAAASLAHFKLSVQAETSRVRDDDFGVPIGGTVVPPEHWTQTALKKFPAKSSQPLDFSTIFGRTAPLIFELGCGNARYTLQSSLERPHCNHLASDILPAVVSFVLCVV